MWVLVVDDEPFVRQSLVLAMADLGWVGFEAATTEEALAMVGRQRFDVLLVDKNLPGPSGLELVRRLRARGNPTPIVLMTGYGSTESALEALHLRVGAYVEKPFDDIFAVLETVGQVVRNGAASDPVRNATAALQNRLAEGSRPIEIVVAVASLLEREQLLKLVAAPADRTIECATSAEALEALARHAPDLLIVDAGASEPDLLRFLANVRELAPDASCVVVAERPSLPLVAGLMRVEVSAVLEKPIVEGRVRGRLGPVVGALRQRSAS